MTNNSYVATSSEYGSTPSLLLSTALLSIWVAASWYFLRGAKRDAVHMIGFRNEAQKMRKSDSSSTFKSFKLRARQRRGAALLDNHYDSQIASASTRQREAHERRVQEEAAAIEAGGNHALVGSVRISVCGKNPERVAGWVALFYELPCFTSLCFIPTAAWAKNAWLASLRKGAVVFGSAVVWDKESFILAEFGIFVVMVTLTVLLTHFGSVDRPLLRVLVLNILLIRITSRAMSLLTCTTSLEHATLHLHAAPGVECWQGRHWFYAGGGIFLVVGVYLAAMEHALVTQNERRPARDFYIFLQNRASVGFEMYEVTYLCCAAHIFDRRFDTRRASISSSSCLRFC